MKERISIVDLQGSFNVFRMKGVPIDMREKGLGAEKLAGSMHLIESKARDLAVTLERELAELELLDDIKQHNLPLMEVHLKHGLATRVIGLAEEAHLKITPASGAKRTRLDPSDKKIVLDLLGPDIKLMPAAAELLSICIQIAAFEARV
jgi:hypothetical protein